MRESSNQDRAEELFLAAIDMPAENRDAWLVEQCDGDGALLREVQSLLKHGNPEDDPLERGLDQKLLSNAGIAHDRGALKVRCPNCHHPIELVDDAELAEVHCLSCGSSFSMVGEQTEPHYLIHKKIGHFELLDRVGIGQFGSVWKARDTKLDRTVAIKIPRRGPLDDRQTEFFLRDPAEASQHRQRSRSRQARRNNLYRQRFRTGRDAERVDECQTALA